MRIAAIADTHGQVAAIAHELSSLALDLLLFGGDHYRDGINLGRALHLPCYAVAGNCDRTEYWAPQAEWLELADKHIWLLHGHRYRVKQGLSALYDAALAKGADIVVFGHTHISYCEKHNGLWMVNPGSAGSRNRSGAGSSWALLEIEAGHIRAQIIPF